MDEMIIFDFVEEKVELRSSDGSTRPAPVDEAIEARTVPAAPVTE